jgi:hypothetical protein
VAIVNELERRHKLEDRGGKPPEEDPMVVAAITEDHRSADDIWLVDCDGCGWASYCNEGSHATCRNCGADLSHKIEEAYTLADYWGGAEYPCDEIDRAEAERSGA